MRCGKSYSTNSTRSPKVYQSGFPVFILLIGLPEERDSLVALEPSLSRIFRIVEIGKLANKEVELFLSDAFEKVGKTVEHEAMELMVQYSSGLHIFMHEIGDATYWRDVDGVIDIQDAYSGIIAAAIIINKKYSDPGVSKMIRSRDYATLVRKLGEIPINQKER